MLLDRLKKDKIYPALLLESTWPNHRRSFARYAFGTAALGFLGAATILSITPEKFLIGLVPTFSIPFLAGLGFVFFGVFSILECLHLFYRFYYLTRLKLTGADIDFLAGLIILSAANRGDYLVGFLYSPFGRRVADRLGFTEEIMGKILDPNRKLIADSEANLNGVINAPLLAKSIFSLSLELKKACAELGITASDFDAVNLLVAWEFDQADKKLRWWDKESFEHLPAIGEDWAYGKLYHLKRYAQNVLQLNIGGIPDQQAVNQMENILNRLAEANVLLIGESKGVNESIVRALAERARGSSSSQGIKGKKFMLVRSGSFVTGLKSKYDFESELVLILNEAVAAGNVILIFDDLPVLMKGASSLGSDLPILLEPYLANSNFQIIALTETNGYHQNIEQVTSLMNRFELVRSESLDPILNVVALLPLVNEVEAEYNLIFTYKAIKEVARAALNYFNVEGEAGDEVRDLLLELGPWLLTHKVKIADKEEILTFLQEKTRVPQGKVLPAERDKLMNLEGIIGKRVIGQGEAVKAVAEALRRSRAGIGNDNRPIASFLFLGPTGVGKTETAKALAEAVFGDEKKLLRLDMSEYQGGDALPRLTGIAGASGTLVSLARGEPYGVFLFDEFEKSSKDVRNLFLQILDEGFFSDSMGKKVFLREHLIIATSNAAADLVWDLVKAGKNLKAETPNIIDYLVKSGALTPELLNRFDAVIVFSPLNEDEMFKVAEKMLGQLAKRLAEKAIKLNVSKDLIDAVAHRGANKVFGARPMLRFIQNAVESAIAKGLIDGSLTEGSAISFEPGDNPLPELGLTLKIERQ